MTTKSGTNALHGDAWEYNRLSDYTSNTVTNAQGGLNKGTYTRNQFGFQLGGPLKKDKMFLFGSSEWIRVPPYLLRECDAAVFVGRRAQRSKLL